MADRTEIAWCDSTFNPWIGCTKVGPGCDHCYAERDMDQRRHRVKWGAGQARSRTSADYWKQPIRWNRENFYTCACGYRGTMRELTTDAVHGCGLNFMPARRRVFCASLADVFDNEVPASWRADLFGLIRATPNLDWLLLTKRIGNAVHMIDEAGGWSGITADGRTRNPLPHVWLGATVVNQAEANRDVPKLLDTPAAVRFVSIEPMLGPIELAEHLEPDWTGDLMNGPCEMHRGLDWVVVGGESGPGARPMHPHWARSLRDRCAAAGVPMLFKQWGEWAPENDTPRTAERNSWGMYRVGKKAAGRLLDGALHDAFPSPRA